jgi:hypothetical protein
MHECQDQGRVRERPHHNSWTDSSPPLLLNRGQRGRHIHGPDQHAHPAVRAEVRGTGTNLQGIALPPRMRSMRIAQLTECTSRTAYSGALPGIPSSALPAQLLHGLQSSVDLGFAREGAGTEWCHAGSRPRRSPCWGVAQELQQGSQAADGDPTARRAFPSAEDADRRRTARVRTSGIDDPSCLPHSNVNFERTADSRTRSRPYQQEPHARG